MADERVRRILSHAIGVVGESSKPCGNSVSAEEFRCQSGRSTGDIIGGGVNASSSHREEHWNLVRRSGSPPGFDKHQAIAGDSELEMSLEPEQQDLESSAGETSGVKLNPGLMNPARGVEAGGRWPGDWPIADDCIFCKIVHGYAPAFKLYEDDYCVCILDINPLCCGHSLLVPKGHFSGLDATPPQIAAAMCSVVPLLSSAIMEATCCDSFNMVVNNGEAAGQVVFHTHFHIVPRFIGDGLWTNESVVRKSLTTFKDPSQLAHAVRSNLRSRT